MDRRLDALAEARRDPNTDFRIGCALSGADKDIRPETATGEWWPPDQWHIYLRDPTSSAAILDRIAHAAHGITLKGEWIARKGKTSTRA
jgi:hypothetical protein